jgi:membrane protein
MPPRPGFPRSLLDAILPTLRYWTQTEVHAFAFSVAANVLLGFFPFLIVSVSLSQVFFSRQTTVAAIDFALRDYFPDALGSFLSNNLPQRPVTDWVALGLLLFSSNGIFVPLEVALNKAWGIQKNRSYLHNQLVSLLLIFSCGTLALLSLGITELRVGSSSGLRIEQWTSVLFFKLAAVPLTSLILFLIYRYLPNGRPPLSRVVTAAIGVGLLLEGLKYLNVLVWPWLDARIQREYGVFRYSATILFLSFLASMLVLAGAEWAARGHRLDYDRRVEADS